MLKLMTKDQLLEKINQEEIKADHYSRTDWTRYEESIQTLQKLDAQLLDILNSENEEFLQNKQKGFAMRTFASIALLLFSVACGKQTKTVTKTVQAPAPKAAPKLVCKVYDVTTSPQGTGSLPLDIEALPELGSVEVESLNNPTSNNLTPFNPFLDTDLVEQVEMFAMVCEGKLKLDTSGAHTFYVNSDDGSKLYVNDFLVVNNDGNHAAVKKGATVTLLKGEVNVRLEYFNGYGDKALVLSMKRPNVSFEELVRF